MKQQSLESAFRRTRQLPPEGAAIQLRQRHSKLCQCRTVSRCDLYNDGFLPAPWLASFFLLFHNRFCRIWLADAWHIGMSRKGTSILSYQFPFFDGRKGQAPRRRELESAGFEPTRKTVSSVRQNLRINRRSANISLLDPWQISTILIHWWVLSYPDAFGVGKTRASPVDKRITGMPSRPSQQGWISEWENTEDAVAPEVELWTAFVSEKKGHLHISVSDMTSFTDVRFKFPRKLVSGPSFYYIWG